MRQNKKSKKDSQAKLDQNEAKIGKELLHIHKKSSSVKKSNETGANQTPNVSDATINKKGKHAHTSYVLDHYVLDQTSSSSGHDYVKYHSKSSDKFKLAVVQFLNSKELLSYPRNIKI